MNGVHDFWCVTTYVGHAKKHVVENIEEIISTVVTVKTRASTNLDRDVDSDRFAPVYAGKPVRFVELVPNLQTWQEMTFGPARSQFLFTRTLHKARV